MSVGAAALGLAGCGSSARPPTTPRVSPPAAGASGAEVLGTLLAIEHYSVAAYTAATPLLSGESARVARQFLGQEVLHTDRLISLIQKAGGSPHRSEASYDLGHPRTPSEVMSLLLEAEQRQVRAYLQAAPLLTVGSLKSAVTNILAIQASHAAIWRLQLGLRPAPSAFVTGNE